MTTQRKARPYRRLPPPTAPTADARIWPLLQRYAKLAKVKLIARGADLYDMKLPVSERAHFGERATVRVALSLEALERDPDAEMAVLGSPFLAHLLEAIRTRAGRLSLGTIPPPHAARRTAHDLDLTVPVRDATARRRKSQLATHTVGRLLARVVLRAGAVVEETVIESAVIDLATGARADDQVTAQFAALETRRIKPADRVRRQCGLATSGSAVADGDRQVGPHPLAPSPFGGGGTRDHAERQPARPGADGLEQVPEEGAAEHRHFGVGVALQGLER